MRLDALHQKPADNLNHESQNLRDDSHNYTENNIVQHENNLVTRSLFLKSSLILCSAFVSERDKLFLPVMSINPTQLNK